MTTRVTANTITSSTTPTNTTTTTTTSQQQQSSPEITEAAKTWTRTIERFKVAIDSLYDICRETQNFAGCREVLLYLKNATHAFETLIVMIDVEQSWEKDPSCKPQSVAWEIKAPSAAISKQQQQAMQEQEEIWHVVSRRRRNTLSSEESGENSNIENRSEKENNKKTNVYERLAYGLRRPVRPFSPEIIKDPDANPGSNLMCPRSAMDLPQTKASMAKMAYSRERLWKGRVKPLLEEKLSTIQRRQARLTYSQVAKQPPKQKSEVDANRSREPSLASISETAEENDDNLSTVTMAEQAGLNSDKILAELGGDDEWLAMTMEEESLAQEEESLQKEILEEERSSIDDEFEREACKQFGKIRYKKSWKDVIANWTQLNEKVSPELCYRKPGEAIQMHEKLLSPSRRRTKTDFEKRNEERQQRAVELRQRLLEEKANRLKELHAKVEEIRQKRIEVEEKKRVLLEEKMEKVSEKRERNLAEVVKRAKDDDLRIQEVQLIKTLEDISRKSEIQSKEEEWQEKKRFLAQKQAKKAEEKAAKYAQVEENRVAKMQRDAEKLLEQTEKSEARLQNAAANRNELLEGMRKKQRKLTEKIDRLKVIENQASQNLIDRMQNKLEKAEKLYEETILNTKQRAAELSSPRPQSCSAMILAECLQPQMHPEDQSGKKCSICKFRIHCALHALAHVCTNEHLKNRKLENVELNFEEVKQELEIFIVSVDEEDDDENLKDIITSTATVSSNESKKKRSKLRQKLLKDAEPLSTLAPNGIIEKGLYRIIKELETQIQAASRTSTLSDSIRNHIEKLFAQFDKQIFEIRDEKERENNFARIVSSTSILESLLKLLASGDFYEPQHQSRQAVKRLYLKSCAFLACLFSPAKVAEVIFASKHFTDLAELLIQCMKLFSTNLHNNYEQGISTLYILYQLGLALSSKDPTIKTKQKLSTLTSFLISHGFIDFIQAVLAAVSEFSITSDKIELSPHSFIAIVETISGFINLVIRQIPEGQDPPDSFHQMFQTYFTISTNFLFCSLPREEDSSCPTSPIQFTENEQIITRSFFASFCREFIRLTPNPKTATFLKKFLFKDDYQNGLRISFILNGILQKKIPKLSKFDELSGMAIRVSAYFASIDSVCQRFCLVGWQNSLLLSLCRTSFDLFGSSHDSRYSVLIAIFSMVRKSKVAIEAMETEIGVSWLSIFLEIFGKLQKFAKALKKSNSREDPPPPPASNLNQEELNKVQRPKVSPSLNSLSTTSTTTPTTLPTSEVVPLAVSKVSANPECSDSNLYNFASLRRRLNKIEERKKDPKKKEKPSPPQQHSTKKKQLQQPQASKKTGKKTTPLKSAPVAAKAAAGKEVAVKVEKEEMPEKRNAIGMTEVIERDRPPRPTPPKPIDIEGDDDEMIEAEEEEQLSEIASISSEEEDELLEEQESERAKNQEKKKQHQQLQLQQQQQQQQQQQYHQIRINHPPQYRSNLQQPPQIREIPIQPTQMIDPTQLIRIPAAAALREKMAEIFAVEEIGTVPLPRLIELRRHIQAIHNIDYFFEAISMNHLNHISVNIVETILHLIDDVDEVNELILKHVKNYLNFLFMCGNRSARFRRTFDKHSALHWLGMLRFDAIRADVIYSLHLFTSNISIFYTDENFMHFLADIITNYQSFPDTSDQKNYICIFIAKLLQNYPYFLHRSYTSLNRNVFNELLTIIEKIVKTKFDDDRVSAFFKPPILGSAVKFIIKFFDISIDDFREERVDWHAHVSRFVHLMDIMSFIIRNVRSFRSFFDKPALMHNVCAVQELLLAGDEINRCHRSGRRVEIPLNRNSGNRRPRNGEDDDIRISTTTTTTCGSAAGNNESIIGSGGEGIIRSKTMPTDGPPDRKYARKTIEQDTIENIPPVSSVILFPLPSVEILEMDISMTFRTRESFLNLYRQRKISAFYILNLKRATLRLLGSLCFAAPSNKDIAAEHEVVENVFKLARAGDSVKVDYVTLVKRALTEICTDHEKNFQALNDIEQHPSHLISKKDVIDSIFSNTHNGTANR